MSELQQRIDNLIDLAKGDTGGARKVAQFLLALWNSQFKADLIEMMALDDKIFNDMLHVWNDLHHEGNQLYTYVSEARMIPIIEQWGDVFRVA